MALRSNRHLAHSPAVELVGRVTVEGRSGGGANRYGLVTTHATFRTGPPCFDQSSSESKSLVRETRMMAPRASAFGAFQMSAKTFLSSTFSFGTLLQV